MWIDRSNIAVAAWVLASACVCLSEAERDDAGPRSVELDIRHGLLGVTLGSARAEIPGLVTHWTSRDGAVEVCRRPSDELRYGGATLTSITYELHRGRLARIALSAEGKENGEALVAALGREFGPPAPLSAPPPRWWGTTATLVVHQLPGGARAVIESKLVPLAD